MEAKKLVMLALAGSVGTLARYGLSGVAQKWGGAGFPWGTLAVNVAGCFAAGAMWSLFEGRFQGAAGARTVVMVGFMGAFTTFSAYMVETSELVRSAEWAYAAGNVVMQNGFGAAALIAGLAIGRAL